MRDRCLQQGPCHRDLAAVLRIRGAIARRGDALPRKKIEAIAPGS
jgi:hypothetical protein